LEKAIRNLQRIDLFSNVDEALLKQVAQALKPVSAVAGTTIIQTGETGDAMYLILSGKVKVHRGDHVLSELGENEFFGEYALVDQVSRSADVTALETTELLRLEQDDFLQLFHNNVNITRSNLKPLIKRMGDKNRLEVELAKRNRQVAQQRDEIDRQQQLLLDSINYAKRIQDSILLTEAEIQRALPGASVFFQPRDIVSGDFYWFREVGEVQVLAVADCTGHGVPGAFMSMIGSMLLNEIVLTHRITEPGEILFHLHKAVLEALQQQKGDTQSQDGMDMVVCTIDRSQQLMNLASARNTVALIRDEGLKWLKGSPHSIGGLLHRPGLVPDPVFTTHSISLEQPVFLALLTDGFLDQFGGQDNTKFGRERFGQMMQEIRFLSPEKQKKKLVDTFTDWKGSETQIDDVLVVMVEVK